MKYNDIKNPMKPRKLTWNEKLAKKGIPIWSEMLAELKTI